MSTNLGAQEAQRIILERQRDADRIARQEREERTLQTEPPRFFEAMAGCLKDNAESFNQGLGVTGDDSLTFVYSSGLIQIGKRSNPFLLRKVMLRQAQSEVVVRTEIMNGYRRSVKEETWHFDIERGELRLEGKTVMECAESLFAGIPDAFR